MEECPGVYLGQFAIPGGLTDLKPHYAIELEQGGAYALYWRHDDQWLYNRINTGSSAEELARFLSVSTNLSEVRERLEAIDAEYAKAFASACAQVEPLAGGLSEEGLA